MFEFRAVEGSSTSPCSPWPGLHHNLHYEGETNLISSLILGKISRYDEGSIESRFDLRDAEEKGKVDPRVRTRI